MNITFTLPHGPKRRLVESVIRQFARELKLSSRKFELVVGSVGGYQKKMGGCAGTITVESSIYVMFDSRIGPSRLLISLAHEMIHVKQLVTGRLRQIQNGKKTTRIWCGKQMDNVPYEKRPWEIQAYTRQLDLVKKLKILPRSLRAS